MPRAKLVCPLCGAKCHRIMGGYGMALADRPIVCGNHQRTYAPRGKFVESGCAYEVPDLRAHLAICAKLAEKPKRRRVVATGWACKSGHENRVHVCVGEEVGVSTGEPLKFGCRPVSIVAEGGR